MQIGEGWERDRQVILAQTHNLILALRTNTKFSSKNRFVEAAKDTEHRLTLGVKQLRETLFCPQSQQTPLDEQQILQPFVDVVMSEETTGPITGVALSAFVAYVDLRCSFVTVNSLVRMTTAASNTRSEVTDVQTHEAVLARILQVYVSCLKHPLAAALDDGVAVGLMESAYRIAIFGEPSELLRRTAEQAMNDMTSAAFLRVPQGGSMNVPLLKFICKLIASDAVLLKEKEVPAVVASVASAQLQGLCLAHTVLFIVKEQLESAPQEAVMLCVRDDLCRALLQVGRHSTNIVVLCQMLRTLHLLVSFASPMIVPQILSFLLTIHMQKAGEPPRFASPRNPTGSPLASPLTPATAFPRAQMDDIERREVEEAVMESLLEYCTNPAFPTFVFCYYDLSPEYPFLLEELCSMLSSSCNQPNSGAPTISQLDVLSLDCLLAMVTTVARRVIKRAALASCNEDAPQIAELQGAKRALIHFAELFRSETKRAIEYAQQTAALPLCDKSSGWDAGEFLFRNNRILDKATVGEYIGDGGREPLRPENDSDGKLAQEWELARADDYRKPGTVRFHQQMLKGFLNCFNFRGKALLRSIRELVFQVRLPGEAQKIDRIMQEFAIQWYSSNKGAPKEINPFSTEDAAFILSFSIIMLNTDLHSKQVLNKLTKGAFISMNRGIDAGADVDEAYLSHVYDEVKDSQIVMVDMTTQGCSVDLAWQLEVEHSIVIEKAAAASGTTISMKGSADALLSLYDRPIFDVIWRPATSSFTHMLEVCGVAFAIPKTVLTSEDAVAAMKKEYPREFAVLESVLRGCEACVETASMLSLHDAVDHVVVHLVGLMPFNVQEGFHVLAEIGRNPRLLLTMQLLFRIMSRYGNSMRASWGDAALLLVKMLLLGLFAENTAVPAAPTTSGEAPLTLLSNPGVALPPTDDAKNASESGWFGGLFGSSEAATQKRKEKVADDKAAVERLRNFMPSLHDVITQMACLTNDALMHAIGGILNVSLMNSGVETKTGAFIASYSSRLAAEIAARSSQTVLVAPLITERLCSVVQTVCGSLTACSPSDAPYWRSVLSRVWESVSRTAGCLLGEAGTFQHAVRLYSTTIVALPQSCPNLEHTIVSVISTTMQQSIQHASTTQWDPLVLPLLLAVAPRACRDGRSAVLSVLISLASNPVYTSMQALSQYVETVAQCVVAAPRPDPPAEADGVGEEWVHIVPGDTVTPVHPAPQPLPPCADDEKAVGVLVQLHHVLVQRAGSPAAVSSEWLTVWSALLRAICLVVFHPSNMRVSSAAILALQRCTLDPHLADMSAEHVFNIFDGIVFPVVERICAARREKHKPTSAGLSMLSPSVLITNVFGPLAGPDKGRASSVPRSDAAGRGSCSNALTVSEEIQSRGVSLLPKAFLHYMVAALKIPEKFVTLWKRLLGTLYALHSSGGDSGVVKEAIQESVKNVVFVIASMAQERPETFAAIPDFWGLTRQLLKPFDFSELLFVHLDRLSVTRVAVPTAI